MCHFVLQIVPATLHRQARTETARPRPAAPRGEGKVSEDRSAYRRTGGEGDKKTEAGAGGAQVEFVSLIQLNLYQFPMLINAYLN